MCKCVCVCVCLKIAPRLQVSAREGGIRDSPGSDQSRFSSAGRSVGSNDMGNELAEIQPKTVPASIGFDS